MEPRPDQDGDCTRCGLPWEPAGETTHECPAGFVDGPSLPPAAPQTAPERDLLNLLLNLTDRTCRLGGFLDSEGDPVKAAVLRRLAAYRCVVIVTERGGEILARWKSPGKDCKA